MGKEELDYWLSIFMLEVHKKMQKNFLPTLYTTFSVIPSLIFKNSELINYRQAKSRW